MTNNELTREAKIIESAQKLTSASSRMLVLLDPDHQDFSTAGLLKVALNEVAQAMDVLGLNFYDYRSLFVYGAKDLEELANDLKKQSNED